MHFYEITECRETFTNENAIPTVRGGWMKISEKARGDSVPIIEVAPEVNVVDVPGASRHLGKRRQACKKRMSAFIQSRM